MVAPDHEYDGLSQPVTKEVLALENIASGRPGVRWVRRAAELYQGSSLGDLPDLFIGQGPDGVGLTRTLMEEGSP